MIRDRFSVYVALDNEKVIGYIDVTNCFKENEPYDIYVKEEFRNKVLDDAQGYGYKTIEGAFKAYKFKRLTIGERKERENKIALVKKWMKHNKKIMNLLEEICFEISKGSWGPDDRFDENLVKKILIENGYDIDELGFTIKELLKYGFN